MVSFNNHMTTMDRLPDYAAEMASFKRSDEAREMLLADLITRYEKLMEDHDNLRNDYVAEQQMRRSFQGDINRMNLQLSTLDNSSFVLGLIDGDGVIFQDILLSGGAKGGSEAAFKLQHAIQRHVASIYSNSSHWHVMVHIYVSLDKLGQKLTQVGLLKHPQEFRAFAQEFNVTQPLFSIIDVGPGKERADHKIREMLRTFSDNLTCKHIIFGGCHDAGYLLNLDPYKHNEAKAARITLLESTTPFRGFLELPHFKRDRFDEVFKPEPLPEYGQTSYGQVPTQAPVPAPILRTMTNRTTSPVAAASPAPVNANVVPSPSTTTSSLNGPSSDSWATVGKSGSANGNISIAPKASPKKRYIYYNKEGFRLDEPLPPRDRAASDAIEIRMDKKGKNLCNHWHLNRGKCAQGAFCHFQHEPKLSPAENIALRYKTRSLACKHRDCDKFDCYLGHQCPNERDQGHCPYGDKCNLRASHGMDKVKYEAWDEDSNVVYSF